MALRSVYTSPTCSGLRYDTSFTTCLPLNKLLRKQMSNSLFIAVPKIRLKPKSVSKLMYLSSTCFIRDSFKLILLQRLCQWVQWKLAFELPSAVQSSAKIRWKFVTSKFLGNFLHWGIEKNKSIGTPCRICAFSLNTLMLWRVACLKLEWGLLQ